MMAQAFTLNPLLNVPDLAEAYARKGRLQVRDAFTEETAERILAILKHEIPWGIAFNDGERVVQLDSAQCARLDAVQRQHLAARIATGARQGYQFVYSFFPLLQAYFDKAAPYSPLFPLLEWLNEPEFLNFARNLTGLSNIMWADAQATMFTSGQFLKYHTDETPSQCRLAAYVINLTKGWGRDWGGLLQFWDDKYDVEEGLRPVFNAINIFTIPADHSVSVIAPYVDQGRFAITGWLRGDQPPERIRPHGR